MSQAVDLEALRTAYVYLLGRAVVVRQEQVDLAEDGADYNVLKHNPVGTPLEWVNPNLDVTNTEGWIAVDDDAPVLLEVPRIDGRYYTVQIVDGWGEVITNINERTYPAHPHGTYAFVTPGSTAELPEGAVRTPLRSGKAKLLARVELRGDPDGAVELQHQLTLRPLGRPSIEPAAPVPTFDNQSLIGVELFDVAAELLASAPDVSPIAASTQAVVWDIVRHAADPSTRSVIDEALRTTVIPEFQRFATQEAGAVGNNWIATTIIGNYGNDYAIRTAANYVGIWANARDEVIYFVTTRDAEGEPLNGATAYTMRFPADDHPDGVVNAYWSLSLVDVPSFLAVPNPIDRYTFNAVAPPLPDLGGGMTIHLGPEPAPGVPESNWLPSPEAGRFSLTFRTYVPKPIVKSGGWFPPAPVRSP